MNDTACFPVATITAGAQPSIDGFLIRFDFLTSPMQRPEEANPGRNYLLSATQARYLAERILSQLHLLESGGSQGSGHPQH